MNEALTKQLERMSAGAMYVTRMSDELLDIYRGTEVCLPVTEAAGNLVAFEDGVLITLWDAAGGQGRDMQMAVRASPITDIFRSDTKEFGGILLPDHHLFDGVRRKEIHGDYVHFRWAMTHISLLSILTMKEFIEALTPEDRATLLKLVDLKRQYTEILDLAGVDDWVWQRIVEPGNPSRVSDSNLGHLLGGLTNGRSIDAMLEAYKEMS